ncbi:MAG: hypothetical protein EXS55_04510 [Candidatus Magasanikbacteria bacterium]|nr:hypothetical protein [Candidatus Magasanikbacteria bacterium]
MPLGNLFPSLPLPFITIAVNVVGFMGALALMYGVLLEAEKNQDAVFVLGSASLFVYALARHDTILMFAMAGIFLIAGREWIQIARGRHHHSNKMIEKYEHPETKKNDIGY